MSVRSLIELEIIRGDGHEVVNDFEHENEPFFFPSGVERLPL